MAEEGGLGVHLEAGWLPCRKLGNMVACVVMVSFLNDSANAASLVVIWGLVAKS